MSKFCQNKGLVPHGRVTWWAQHYTTPWESCRKPARPEHAVPTYVMQSQRVIWPKLSEICLISSPLTGKNSSIVPGALMDLILDPLPQFAQLIWVMAVHAGHETLHHNQTSPNLTYTVRIRIVKMSQFWPVNTKHFYQPKSTCFKHAKLLLRST